MNIRDRLGDICVYVADIGDHLGDLVFMISVWCGLYKTDLGGNNLKAKLTEIADYRFISSLSELFRNLLLAQSCL